MKTIKVTLKSTTPLLMHNPEAMSLTNVTKNPAKQYDDEEFAEKAAYRDDKGFLCIPARCLKACIIGAASWYKFGKKSAKPIVAGCIRLEPVNISLGVKDFKIDRRPVVVNRGRVMRARPCLDKWNIDFNLIYDDKMIGDPEILRNIIEEAGRRVGLLDNRPQKYGENGCFEVSKWLPDK